MKTLIRIGLIVLAMAISACGGTPDITCDEVQYYQTAVIGKRVESPEGLDSLEEVNEMPLPEAAPRPPREPGSPCFDRPPGVSLGT